MRIDVHSHYWAASYLDELVRQGRTDLTHAGRQRDDLDERVAEMDAVGVDVSVLSAIGLEVYVGNAMGDTASARHVNDVYAAVVDRYAGRFRAFGSVPLPFVDEAIAETDRALGELGFSGLALQPSYGGIPIDDPRFEPFWANLARHGATTVYVHPVGAQSAGHPGLADFGLHTALGSPTQIAAAPVRIAFSGVSTRYPDLQFVFAMCGGTLPLLWKRFDRNLRRGLEMSATAAVGRNFFSWVDDLPIDRADPMGLMRRFWYDTAIQDVPEALLLARESYGADRLVLGSDAIFASLSEAVRYVEDSPYLEAPEKRAVLDEAAQSFLRLPTPVRA